MFTPSISLVPISLWGGIFITSPYLISYNLSFIFFLNYRVGYAASEAVVLMAIVLLLTLVQFRMLREKGKSL